MSKEVEIKIEPKVYAFGSASFRFKAMGLKMLTYYSQMRMISAKTYNDAMKDVNTKPLDDILAKIRQCTIIKDQVAEILTSGMIDGVKLTKKQKADYEKRKAANDALSDELDADYFNNPLYNSIISTRATASEVAMQEVACTVINGKLLIQEAFENILVPVTGSLDDIDYTGEEIIDFAKEIINDFFLLAQKSRKRHVLPAKDSKTAV